MAWVAMKLCEAIKRDGHRCSRIVVDGCCWQHRK